MEADVWMTDDYFAGACDLEQVGKPKLPQIAGQPSASSELRRPSRDSVREMLREAFEGLGGVDALKAWGKSHPTEFYRLCGRLIPVEVKGSMSQQVTIVHSLRPTKLDLHGRPETFVADVQNGGYVQEVERIVDAEVADAQMNRSYPGGVSPPTAT